MNYSIGMSLALALALNGEMQGHHNPQQAFDVHGQVLSPQVDDRLGSAVANVGDVDGDGVPDWAAGAPDSDLMSEGGGSLQIYSGSDGSSIWRKDGMDGEGLGRAIAGAGDLNGDGYADVLVGAIRAGRKKGGAVIAYSGFDGSVLYQRYGSGGGFGYSVSQTGDLDGDNVPDWIAGAPEAAFDGYVYVYSGKVGAFLFAMGGPDRTLFGESVAGIDDVDLDGVPDFAVGAPIDVSGGIYDDPPSRVYVYSGASGSEIYHAEGTDEWDLFGSGVVGTDDADGDGIGDLLVGAPVGRYARLLSGATGEIIHELLPNVFSFGPGYCGFGKSVSLGGDWDCDGIRDLLVGVPARKSPTFFLCPGDSGIVQIFSARTGKLIGGASGMGNDGMGFSVAGYADVTGDGIEEILVGAPNDFASYAAVLSTN